MQELVPELPRRIARTKWTMFAYTGSMGFLKSLILAGFITNPPFLVPDVRNAVEHFIPSLTVYVCFIAIVLAPSLLLKNKGHYWYLALINLILSSIFLFDLWYFRAFSRFTSAHHLHQSANFHNLSAALFSFVHPTDFFVLLDALTLILVLLFWKARPSFRPRLLTFALFFGLPAGYLIYLNMSREINNSRLFAFRWIPLETMTTLSPAGYHLLDLYAYGREKIPHGLSAREREEIQAWLNANPERLPANKYKGLFRGYNLVLLQCESLENFVIGKQIDGQEITPTMNSMIRNAFYFTNFMEQVGDGTSIDAEFLANTSVYPLRRGSVSWRYPHNTYNSLPKLLGRLGYWTVDIHPDAGSYWNWQDIMARIGMNECVDDRSFVKDDIIDLGLSDGTFLRQVAPMIAHLKQPFYQYMISLSNHVPFDLPRKYRELHLDEKLDRSEIGGYFQGVRYLDRHIGALLAQLDADGLLQNTVVGLFGDHCGIHKFSREALALIPESEKRWMENGKRVPFILFKKGMAGESIDVIGGQIDMLPTIAYLFGVDEAEYAGTAMGRNLLNTRKSFAILNDGEYISSENGEQEREHARKGMELADIMLQGNYFGVK